MYAQEETSNVKSDCAMFRKLAYLFKTCRILIIGYHDLFGMMNSIVQIYNNYCMLN